MVFPKTVQLPPEGTAAFSRWIENRATGQDIFRIDPVPYGKSVGRHSHRTVVYPEGTPFPRPSRQTGNLFHEPFQSIPAFFTILARRKKKSRRDRQKTDSVEGFGKEDVTKGVKIPFEIGKTIGKKEKGGRVKKGQGSDFWIRQAAPKLLEGNRTGGTGDHGTGEGGEGRDKTAV
jgi:hypothetical protein